MQRSNKIFGSIILIIWWVSLFVSWNTLDPIVFHSRWIYPFYGGLVLAGIVLSLVIGLIAFDRRENIVFRTIEKVKSKSTLTRWLLVILISGSVLLFQHKSRYGLYLDFPQFNFFLLLNFFIASLTFGFRRLDAYNLLRTPLLDISFITSILLSMQYEALAGSAFLRVILFICIIVFLAFVFGGENHPLPDTRALIIIAIFLTSLSVLAFYLQDVSTSPLSLAWSEGNRLWDYSLYFGSDIYNFPERDQIFSLTDQGRQMIGGAPFLIEGVSIFWVRLWNAIDRPLLYSLLALIIFYSAGAKKGWLTFLSLWGFVFLNEGPIHPPLIIGAILVTLAWNCSFWIGIPLIIISTLFMNVRITWTIAPITWYIVLVLNKSDWKPKIRFRWVYLFYLMILGSLAAGIFIVFFNNSFQEYLTAFKTAWQSGLLWYRLFPNSTLNSGVLLQLILAVAPISLLFVVISKTEAFKPNWIQNLVMIGAQSAFLIIGLVVSTKIGGGGDLHNMDMFIIGTLFLAGIIWKNGGGDWIRNNIQTSKKLQAILFLIVLMPGLNVAKSFNLNYQSERPTLGEATRVMEIIQDVVDEKQSQGEILFSDQRQFLTFGYVDVPLVDDYEKKWLMEMAMRKDMEGLEKYYQDLAEQRFSLIVTEKLHADVYKASSGSFGEENDAWVNYISNPTLCFYTPVPESKTTEDLARIMLLEPVEDIQHCIDSIDEWLME